MPIFSVNESLCRKDGICAAICPALVIKGEKGEIPHVRAKTVERCIGCGHCVVFCPANAVSLEGLPMDTAIAFDEEQLPSKEQTAMLLKSRRSIRKFKKEPVPKETLLAILDSANYAPTAKNKRPVRWVIIHDREEIVKLGDLVYESLTGADAETSKSTMNPEARALSSAWKRGFDPIFRDAPHLVCAVTPRNEEGHWNIIDAAIALTYLEIAAVPYNVGACWAGHFTHACGQYEPLRKALGLKEDEQVAGAQMMGFMSLKTRTLPPKTKALVDWR